MEEELQQSEICVPCLMRRKHTQDSQSPFRFVRSQEFDDLPRELQAHLHELDEEALKLKTMSRRERSALWMVKGSAAFLMTLALLSAVYGFPVIVVICGLSAVACFIFDRGFPQGEHYQTYLSAFREVTSLMNALIVTWRIRTEFCDTESFVTQILEQSQIEKDRIREIVLNQTRSTQRSKDG